MYYAVASTDHKVGIALTAVDRGISSEIIFFLPVNCFQNSICFVLKFVKASDLLKVFRIIERLEKHVDTLFAVLCHNLRVAGISN